MFKKTILGFGALGLLLAGGAWIMGQTETHEDAAPETAVPAETAEIDAMPEADVQSYSVVTENRIGPDGKRVQKRKVWQNGTLVEEKEEVIEGDDGQLSAEMDGETVPGLISRSEQNGGFFGFPGNMDEMLRGMQESLQGVEEEMNAFRSRFFGDEDSEPGAPGNMLDENVRERMRQARERAAQARDYADAQRAEILRRFGGAAPAPLSEYWLGASVTPVSDETAYQLGLAEGEGLLIREIVSDSPAAKAGLEKFDILLAIGGQPVSSAEQIGRIVDGASGSPLTVSYIRKGQRLSAELTPEKRPESQAAQVLPPAVNQAMPEPAAEREQIRVVRPGMILPETQNDSLVTGAAPAEQTAAEDLLSETPADAPQVGGQE